jgi:integrase
MGLGPLHTVSLAEARAKARQCRQLRLEGIDPIEARRAERAAAQITAATSITFKQCASRYITAYKPSWGNARHLDQWERSLAAYAYPTFGELPVQAVDTGLVMRVLEPIWHSKPETASRVRGRVESILDWAAARGYRTGDNPARWRGHLENLLPRKSKLSRIKHHTALPYSELPEFMTELRRHDDIEARALEFTILTAARTNEVIGGSPNEIDFDKGVWTVSAARMKAGKEHRVPLSDDALALLRVLGAPSMSRLFPIAPTAMLKFLRRQLQRDEITIHGFRASFRDWAGEKTNFRSEDVERALAHTIENQTEAAYNRTDLLERRRPLMDAWARFCAGQEAKVVPLHSQARPALTA